MVECPECFEEFTPPLCSCGYRTIRPNTVIFRSTEHEVPLGITREEFGVQLYNTIVLIGGLIQLRHYLGKVAMGELEPRDFKEREVKLIDQLRTALLALKPDDLTQVVRRYPWVATL